MEEVFPKNFPWDRLAICGHHTVLRLPFSKDSYGHFVVHNSSSRPLTDCPPNPTKTVPPILHPSLGDSPPIVDEMPTAVLGPPFEKQDQRLLPQSGGFGPSEFSARGGGGGGLGRQLWQSGGCRVPS